MEAKAKCAVKPSDIKHPMLVKLDMSGTSPELRGDVLSFEMEAFDAGMVLNNAAAAALREQGFSAQEIDQAFDQFCLSLEASAFQRFYKARRSALM